MPRNCSKIGADVDADRGAGHQARPDSKQEGRGVACLVRPAPALKRDVHPPERVACDVGVDRILQRNAVNSDWFKQRVRTNLAVFFEKYDNLQNPNSGRTFGAARPDLVAAGHVLANVGDTEAFGFELESVFKPVVAAMLFANLGYTHFEYTKLLQGYCQSKCTRLTDEVLRVGLGHAQTKKASQPVSLFQLVA